jgi:DNA end-binding protein Ku
VAPRSIWNGAVAFGAVNVPIKVFGAIEDKGIRFKELHAKDGAEVGHQLVGPDGSEMDRERVAKGYEIAPDEYVMLSNDEIKAANQPARRPSSSRTSCPPSRSTRSSTASRTTWLRRRAPRRSTRCSSPRSSSRAASGSAASRCASASSSSASGPVDGVLRMQVMRFADELVPGKDMDVDEPSQAPSEREVGMAGTLVDTLSAKFDPAKYEDTYRERVLDLVRRKEQGEELDLAPAPAPEQSDDLMAALEASLKAAKG